MGQKRRIASEKKRVPVGPCKRKKKKSTPGVRAVTKEVLIETEKVIADRTGQHATLTWTTSLAIGGGKGKNLRPWAETRVHDEDDLPEDAELFLIGMNNLGSRGIIG